MDLFLTPTTTTTETPQNSAGLDGQELECFSRAFASKHDRREQSALGGAVPLALSLHCAIRKGLTHDGPVPLSQNSSLPFPQTSGVPGPPGEGSGWTEPSAGQEEEEGTEN